MRFYSSESKIIDCGKQLDQGGQASIYLLENRPDQLAKIYKEDFYANLNDKLTYMIANPPEDPLRPEYISIAWPTETLHHVDGTLVGYLMPYIEKSKALINVINPKRRQKYFSGFDRRYLYTVALNLAIVFRDIHQTNGGTYIIGDVNEKNFLVNSSAIVTIIDTDSFQVWPPRCSPFPCIVGKPDYLPPELQKKSILTRPRRLEEDYFALGVLIFQILMEGRHPFDVNWTNQSDELLNRPERIERGYYPYQRQPPAGITSPPGSFNINDLHPGVVNLLNRCFIEGHQHPERRPTPKEWAATLAIAKKSMKPCLHDHFNEAHLQYCPNCARPSRSKPKSSQPSNSTPTDPFEEFFRSHTLEPSLSVKPESDPEQSHADELAELKNIIHSSRFRRTSPTLRERWQLRIRAMVIIFLMAGFFGSTLGIFAGGIAGYTGQSWTGLMLIGFGGGILLIKMLNVYRMGCWTAGLVGCATATLFWLIGQQVNWMLFENVPFIAIIGAIVSFLLGIILIKNGRSALIWGSFFGSALLLIVSLLAGSIGGILAQWAIVLLNEYLLTELRVDWLRQLISWGISLGIFSGAVASFFTLVIKWSTLKELTNPSWKTIINSKLGFDVF